MRFHTKRLLAPVFAALALTFSITAPAQTAPAAGSAASAELTSGEIRKVDKEAGKITIRHERIKPLDMPAMTMVFGVRDPKMLDAVKAGDKIRFSAVDEGGGKLVLTEVQPAK